MAYITSTDVANYLNITLETSGEAVMDDVVAAVCEYADTFCGRSWIVPEGENDEITEVFDADSRLLQPSVVPVSEVVSLTDDGLEIDSSVIYNYGTFIKVGAVLSGIPRALTLTYKTAVTDAPADLKHALIQWAGQIFKAHGDAGKEVTRVTAGSVSADFAASKGGVPPFVLTVLRKYRLVV